MLPLLMELAFAPSPWRLSRLVGRRPSETALFAVALGASQAIVFFALTNGRYDVATALYAPIPVLLWAGLRLGPAGTGFALSMLAGAAILGMDHGRAALQSDRAVLRLQLFLFLTAMPMLCVAVVANALRDAVLLYRALLASLQDQVAILDAKGTVIRVNESWRRHAEAPSPCPFEQAASGDNFLACCRRASEMLAALHPEDREPAVQRLLDGATAVLAGDLPASRPSTS